MSRCRPRRMRAGSAAAGTAGSGAAALSTLTCAAASVWLVQRRNAARRTFRHWLHRRSGASADRVRLFSWQRSTRWQGRQVAWVATGRLWVAAVARRIIASQLRFKATGLDSGASLFT